ncbi:c-type cytochrome [Comamonadaceae bacterium G21597-S1]|nr:c-type cytochrome [Comamonadaceae bacterium G21597-S1]
MGAWLLVLGPAAGAAPFEDSMAQRMLACTGCHGKDGRAEGNVYFPRIAGKPAGYLFNQLRNFRDGRRSYALMTGMVTVLSDDYLREIAQHFSALELPYPPPAASNLSVQSARVAQALIEQGDPQRRLAACTACHGAALTGVLPHVPGLLGLPRDYINAQLGAWKTGQRHAGAPDCMAQVARSLTVDEVAAISSWLAAQALPANTHAVAAGALDAQGARARPACGSAPELAGPSR